MKNKSLKELFSVSMGQTLITIITFNVLYLIFELIQLDNFKGFHLKFQHGYFILNGEEVGINLFANIAGFTIMVISFMIYHAYKHKPNSEA